ncbi:MAG TPA: SDR family oxidoreductase [Nocardioidaceae bacterium]|nr:SDR family oxidoreductase [Nocardioidaceae bacterium]
MPLTSLRGHRVFLTGAASGIGRATALAAAAEGAELFLTDLHGQQLDQVVADVRDSGGRVAYAKPVDVADFDAVRTLADEIHDEHGSMDVVMNIAGISTWGTIDRLSHEHWRRTVDIDLMGPIHVMECFVPPMIEAGRGGQLVNVSSAAGLFGLPWHAPYSAAKFGLRGVSEVLRFDLAQHGIDVTLVCPGAVNTPLVGTVDIVGVDRDSPDVRKLIGRFQRHAVSPEDAAAAIMRGMRSRRHLVFTSRDIAFGHWWQRKFAPAYNLAMWYLNRRVTKVAERHAR